MIRLVFRSNSFTKFGVCLYKPSIVFMSLNLFDMGPSLTIHILLNKVFEWFRVPQDLRVWSLLIRSDRKQG